MVVIITNIVQWLPLQTKPGLKLTFKDKSQHSRWNRFQERGSMLSADHRLNQIILPAKTKED